MAQESKGFSHSTIEQNTLLLIVLTLITVSIGALVQIVPLFTIETTIEKVEGVRPKSPLELAGYNIYVREGCFLCHSQMVRPFRDEAERYGHYSLAAESMYDHPFQWGSKRTGPDLARVGGKYSNDWHVAHLVRPQDVVPESVMPAYAWMKDRPLKYDDIAEHLKTLKALGDPYTPEQIANAKKDMETQINPESGDVAGLLKRYPKAVVANFTGNKQVTEMDALVAYLQSLGTFVDFTKYTPQQLQQ